MKAKEARRAARFREGLLEFDRRQRLAGLNPPGHLDCLVEQMVDSCRRVEFAHHMRDTAHDERRTDPGSDLFDPLKAAVLQYRRGNSDEAFWLVFLATHFGKHEQDGWRLARDVYGHLGGSGRWDWASTSGDLAGFREWVARNEATLRGCDGVKRRFSNHRKYSSLRADSSAGLAPVVESYVGWVQPERGHQGLIRELHVQVGQNPREVFDALYRSMDEVLQFGRLGKFDFLAMLGKLGIAPIEPGSAYLREATGPLAGARLLFVGDAADKRSDRELDALLGRLDVVLGVGMQVLEDSLCNWQKKPAKYERFKG